MSIRASEWELETADNCQLPKYIPDICERCRDYEYCHRQLTLTELIANFSGWDEIVEYYESRRAKECEN